MMKIQKHLLISFLIIANCSFGQNSGVDQMVQMTNKQPLQQEMSTGIKPVLTLPSEGWTPFIKQNMNEIWKSIKLHGVNYYSLGEPIPGNAYSTRSDFKSPFYQGWFGSYVIEAKNQLFDFPNDSINTNKKEMIDKLMQIAVLDQSSWLFAMGDSNAFHSTALTDSSSNYVVIDHLSIEGMSVPVIYFTMHSHSDLNDGTTELSGIVGKPLTNYWKSDVDSNHPVVLSGFYIYWFNKTDQTLKIIYGNGCHFATKDGQVFNTYPLLKNGMLAMASQIKYIHVP